jgi:multidrug efflux pump subunit AcrA (membrane-fusion protein)
MRLRRRFLWRREGVPPTELVVEACREGKARVQDGEGEHLVDFARLPGGRGSIILPSGLQVTGRVAAGRDGRVEAWVRGRRLAIGLSDPLRARAAAASQSAVGASEVRAQIPGRVIEVRVAVGDCVSAGTTMIVLEAMKMQNEIRAESSARVTRVECAAGDPVEAGALLLRLEPQESPESQVQGPKPGGNSTP